MTFLLGGFPVWTTVLHSQIFVNTEKIWNNISIPRVEAKPEFIPLIMLLKYCASRPTTKQGVQPCSKNTIPLVRPETKIKARYGKDQKL